MTIADFKAKLESNPAAIQFEDTMLVIKANYTFAPTAFVNGDVENESGLNSGSCKLFAFALKASLSKDDTLACFGQYYRGVLTTPEGNDHQNIRNFMKTGFEGLSFEGEALAEK